MSNIRVLIAEDHRTVREGLEMILKAQPDIEVVGEAGDGQAAVELAKALNPDIVIMDVSMPQLNGLKATRIAAYSSECESLNTDAAQG